MVSTRQEKYDLILIQPPLFSGDWDSVTPIERQYWGEMKKYAGMLLGDLPTEGSWGLLSIATYARQQGYSVKLIDFHLMDYLSRKEKGMPINMDDIKKVLRKQDAGLFGLTVMTLASDIAHQITANIKELHSLSRVFWGGFYPANNADNLLLKDPNIDFITRGEGELVTLNILKTFVSKSISHNSVSSAAKTCLYFSSINGITYRDGTKIKKNRDEQLMRDLDELPFPDYTFYEERFRDLIIPRVYASRGCEKACSFCTSNAFRVGNFRKRSPQKVVDEIEHIHKMYNKRFFVLGDLEFLTDVQHAKEICEDIIKRRLDIKWWCQIFPPNVKDDIIHLMKQAGCIQIALGMESTSNGSLQQVNKQAEYENSLSAVTIIKKHAIQVQAYIVFGLPGETLDSANKMIRKLGELLKAQLIDVTHIGIMVPYPGSPMYANPAYYNISVMEHDYSKYFMNCDVYGSGVPVYKTDQLESMEIYALWQMALAHVQRYFKYNRSYRDIYFKLYEQLGLNERGPVLEPPNMATSLKISQ